MIPKKLSNKVLCRPKVKPTGLASLTPRQLAVLHHVAQGLSGAAIGKAMGISYGCVMRSGTDIRKRLEVRDLQEAAVMARERIAACRHQLPLGPTGRSRVAPDKAPLLSPSLLEVLVLMAEGATPAEAARELGLPVETVAARRARLLRALDVPTIREAGRKARRLGLLPRRSAAG